MNGVRRQCPISAPGRTLLFTAPPARLTDRPVLARAVTEPKMAVTSIARLTDEYALGCQYHSSRTYRIQPDTATLLAQSAASLQRFAAGSDAASEQLISQLGLCPTILLLAVI